MFSAFVGHSFILHKCTASAQLNKKIRNEDMQNASLNEPSENLLGKQNDSFAMPKRNSSFHAMHLMSAFFNSKLNNNNLRSNYRRH